MERYLRVNSGSSYHDFREKALKRISLKTAKKRFSNIPEEIVERAFYEVNGKPKKKTETSEEA